MPESVLRARQQPQLECQVGTVATFPRHAHIVRAAGAATIFNALSLPIPLSMSSVLTGQYLQSLDLHANELGIESNMTMVTTTTTIIT